MIKPLRRGIARISPELLNGLAVKHRAAGRVTQAIRFENAAAFETGRRAVIGTPSPSSAEAGKAKQAGRWKKLMPANASAEFARGFNAAMDRFCAVMASPHAAGREIRAIKYLDTTASAEEIITLLASDPPNSNAREGMINWPPKSPRSDQCGALARAVAELNARMETVA